MTLNVSKYKKYSNKHEITSQDGQASFKTGKDENYFGVTSSISSGVNNVRVGRQADGSYGMSITSGAMNIYDGAGNVFMKNGQITASGIAVLNLSAISAQLGDVIIGGSENVGGTISVRDRDYGERVLIDKDGFKTAPATVSSGTGYGISSGYKVWLGNLQGFLDYQNNEYGIGIGTDSSYLTYDADQGLRIKGPIEATSIETTTGHIGGWEIDGAKLFNDNAYLSSSGYLAFGDTPPTAYGNNIGAWLGFANGESKISLYKDANNYLQFTTGGGLSVKGTITTNRIEAVDGTVGGWTIDGAKLYNANTFLSSSGYTSFGNPPPTAYGNNVGTWFGYAGGKSKMSLYTDANNYLQFDGDEVLLSAGTGAASTTINSSNVLVCSGARIAGTVSVGGSDNIDGMVMVKSGSGEPMVTLDNQGVTVYEGNFLLEDDNSDTLYEVGVGNNLIRDHNFENIPANVNVTTGGETHTPILVSQYSENGTVLLSSNTYKLAQSFTNTGDSCTGVTIVAQVHLPGDTSIAAWDVGILTARIETDNAGSPSGTLVDALATTTITGDFKPIGITSYFGKVSDQEIVYLIYIPFDDDFSLDNGTNWLVLSSSNAATYNWTFARNTVDTGYSGGSAKQYNGATWSALNYDLSFAINGMTGAEESDGIYTPKPNDKEQDGKVCTLREWMPVGMPRMYWVDEYDTPYKIGTTSMGAGGSAFLISDKTIFDRKTMVVNQNNYVQQMLKLAPSTEFTTSITASPRGGSAGDFYGNTNASSLKCRIYSNYYESDWTAISSGYSDTVIDASYADATDRNKVVRAKHTFITPPETEFVMLRFMGESDEWIRVDGAQLVGGSKPTQYNAESNLWMPAIKDASIKPSKFYSLFRKHFIPATQSYYNNNWSSVAFHSSYFLNLRVMSDGNQNDEIWFLETLLAGTYTFELWSYRSTDIGIYSVYFGGNRLVGTIDGYGAGAALISTITGIKVDSSEDVAIKLKMATKNDSSSDYLGAISAIVLTRTA